MLLMQDAQVKKLDSACQNNLQSFVPGKEQLFAVINSAAGSLGSVGIYCCLLLCEDINSFLV